MADSWAIFTSFVPAKNQMDTLQFFIYLFTWWRHNRVTSHVTSHDTFTLWSHCLELHLPSSISSYNFGRDLWECKRCSTRIPTKHF